ncbi:MAG TPA: Spy/CpxP family protein refolding chaperone [Terracidiphilus sp.]|nr:Spy/CpxP family protein refolding chaperone [Terracidiphilus sp.]
MKRSIASTVGWAIVGIFASVGAFAQGPGGGPGPMGGDPGFGGHRPPFERAFGGGGFEGRWWNNPKIVDRLKLTDDQRKAFDQILLQHRETLIDLHANLAKAELALEPLVNADQPNESSILSQIDKVAQARAELEKANARYLLALRGKLTPDQWKQVQAFRQNRGREMWRQGERRGRSDGPGANEPNPPPPGPGPQGMVDDGPPTGGAPGAGGNF